MTEPSPVATPVAPPEVGIVADDPADKIFLLDYLADMEIGAYAEEQGVTQKVRIDVVLEVVRTSAHLDDRVGRVVNYDDLVSAIEELAAGPRMNLLETFAERLSQAVLVDPRARRVTIRMEKLERLPSGARLGVEIVRTRSPEANERVWALAPELR